MGLRIETLLEELSSRLSLRLICGEEGLKRELSVPDINRPGLAMTGFFEYFPSERLQVIGKTEITYWNTLSAAVRQQRLAQIFESRPAGFVISNEQIPPPELIEMGGKAGIPVMATPMPTANFVTALTVYLEDKMAPTVIMHGTLVDVFGAGILILGESGIGKSEAALALLDKGHRLCADDVVDIRRTPEKLLIGTGVASLRYHMEIRGLGIIDINSLFGARAVRDRKIIELVIILVDWEGGRHYDRSGLDDKTYRILDVDLPMHELPVQTGKNIAVLIEVAAMNWRLRQMGIHPAEKLDQKIKDGLARRTHDQGDLAGLGGEPDRSGK